MDRRVIRCERDPGSRACTHGPRANDGAAPAGIRGGRNKDLGGFFSELSASFGYIVGGGHELFYTGTDRVSSPTWFIGIGLDRGLCF